MPPPKGKKKASATHREAVKRGIVATPATLLDPEIASDPTYKPCEEEEESDVEAQVPSVKKSNVSTSESSEKSASEPSRTTKWRNATGATKKARAVKRQRSIASIFQKRVKPTVAPIPGSAEQPMQLCEEEEEEAEEDVEIKEISRPQTPQADVAMDFELDTVAVAQAIDVDAMCHSPGAVIDIDAIDDAAHTRIDCQHPELVCDVDIADAPSLAGPVLPTSNSAAGTSGDIEQDLPERVEVVSPPGLRGGYAETGNRVMELKDPKIVHQKLRRLVEALRKNYRSKKTLLTDDNAAERLLDLEAIDQFNDARLKLQMQIDKLKLRAKNCSYRVGRQRILTQASRIQPSANASRDVAHRRGKGPYYARLLARMAKELLLTGTLPESRRGKGAYHKSHLLNPRVASSLQAWVKGSLDFDAGGFNGTVTPAKLRRYVNEFLFPELEIEDTISLKTALSWLKKLGFNVSRVQKGIYVDGHERADVVEARNTFINYMYTQVLPFAYSYEGTGDELVEIAPQFQTGKIHYPIFHDETCVHANDLESYVWMREGEQPLRNKSRGRIVHVSDFIIEACGRLYLSPEEIDEQMKLPKRPDPPSATSAAAESSASQSSGSSKSKRKTKTKKTSSSTTSSSTYAEQNSEWIPPPPPAPFKSYRLESFDARRIIYPGANYDPWWDMPQLIAQTKDAIEIFNAKFPNGTAVFIFDCSSAHEAYASDALIAHKMNRNPGGKQPVMHDTVIPSTGERQSMVFPENYEGLDSDGLPLAGRPKGMEQILRERNLLHVLDQKGRGSGGYVGVCNDCKKSQAAREAALREARAKQDEIEGSGAPALNTRGISEMDTDDQARSQTCCMQRVLSLQQDFLDEKPLLQLVIEKAGHICLFLPKFHCELNPIEMVWGQTKQRFRARADGSFKTAQSLVPECLDAVTTTNIRKYFRHCYRYMSAYRLGLNLKQAAYAVKKYRSHRRVPNDIVMDVNVIVRGQTG